LGPQRQLLFSDSGQYAQYKDKQLSAQFALPNGLSTAKSPNVAG